MNVQKRIDSFLAPAPQDKVKRAQQFGWIIYYACVLTFTGHILNWTFATFAGSPFFIALGIIGGLGLTGNALVLPLVVKEWTVTTSHRTWAIAVYILDFVLMAGFVWVDTNLLRGNVTQLVQDYAYWIAPVTGLIPIASWAGLFILDPEAREKYKMLLMERKAHEIRFKADMARQVAEAEIYAEQILAPYQNDQKQPENDIYSGSVDMFSATGENYPNDIPTAVLFEDYPDDMPPADFFEDYPGHVTVTRKSNGTHPKV